MKMKNPHYEIPVILLLMLFILFAIVIPYDLWKGHKKKQEIKCSFVKQYCYPDVVWLGENSGTIFQTWVCPTQTIMIPTDECQ
jgi:hypothetical protein